MDVSGGMDARNKPWIVQQNFSTYLENLAIDRPGAREKALGVESIGSGTGTTALGLPHGVMKWYDRQLDQEVLLSVNGNEMFLWPGNAQYLQVACGASMYPSLHMGQQGLWQPGGFLDDAMFVSSAHRGETNHSAASLLSVVSFGREFSQNASMAPYCTVWWGGRLWVGGNALAETPDTLWWSELNDGLLFSVNNTVQIEPGRGGRIVAIIPIRALTNRLLVLKEDLIAQFEAFWGNSSAAIPQSSDALDTVKSSVRTVAENVGCVAALSVQYVPGAQAGDIFFLAKDGVRAISRASDDTVSGAALPVSAIIQDIIDRINFQQAHKCTSAVIDQAYHLAVPLDGATDLTHVLIYNIVQNQWSVRGWTPRAFAVARLSDTRDRLWMQYNAFTTDSNASGYLSGWHVYRCYEGDVDPNGAPVTWQEDTRAFSFGYLENKKRWEWMGIQLANANATCTVDVQYRVDNGAWNPLGSMMFPIEGGQIVVMGVDPLPWTPNEITINGKKLSLADIEPGYTMQFRLVSSSTTEWSHPAVMNVLVAGRPIQSEFDNSIT